VRNADNKQPFHSIRAQRRGAERFNQRKRMALAAPVSDERPVVATKFAILRSSRALVTSGATDETAMTTLPISPIVPDRSPVPPAVNGRPAPTLPPDRHG
jgi:hypothetical protein